jgi:hypothetical protein
MLPGDSLSAMSNQDARCPLDGQVASLIGKMGRFFLLSRISVRICPWLRKRCGYDRSASVLKFTASCRRILRDTPIKSNGYKLLISISALRRVSAPD